MTDWITQFLERMGYAGIALLMFLENLFPPIPSEIIMPLAGFAASEGKLNIVGVMLAGTAGTLSGAFFWYGVARWLGEARLRHWANRHGRWVTLSSEDIDKLEEWLSRHGRWAVPVAHVIPGLRTLVSIPAGIFAMPPLRFAILTTLGAGFWNIALGTAGYMLGEKFSTVDRYLGPASTVILASLTICYLGRVWRFKAR